MHVSILVPKGQYSIVNIAGSHHMFSLANMMYKQQSGQDLFELDFVGMENGGKDQLGLFSIDATKPFSEIKKTDLILIPAIHNDMDQGLKENEPLINWISQQHAKGTELATFCIGAYLLAQSGLLNGLPCSTHWMHAQELKRRFPKVQVQAEHIVTDCKGIYTSGGAYAFTNLLVYLIEKYGGRELAILVAKSFMIDIDKVSQSPFTIFTGQKEHNDQRVLEVQAFIEENYLDRLNVDELSSKFATTRRTLERNFKKATGNTLNEYQQRVRMEVAKKQLEQGRKNVNEVMFEVGYSDGPSFRDVFRRYVGISPMEYRDKFSRRAVG